MIQLKQLNPILNNENNNYRRVKRGLINGLGSIIKALTGNLDQSDAEKYDKAINTLSSNQIKLKTLVTEQITLLNKSIENFENTTNTLAHNQLILQSRIKQAERIVKTVEFQKIKVHEVIIIQLVITQILTAYQVIADLLEKIEVAISFSKLNTFHNSIVDPLELLNEIKSIKSHLSNNGKLPYEPTIENILLFEKIVEIQSYSKDNKIIFIIKIPIVEINGYNYYHLYPLPMIKQETMQMIIPKSKHLILNEHKYTFFNYQCKKVTFEEFLCHETSIEMFKENNPCEIEMLEYNNNPRNCQTVEIEARYLKIENLEENKWMIVAPNKTVAVQHCDNSNDNIPLHGTYILEMNSECEVQIDSFKLKNYRNVKSKFKLIELPQIKINKISVSESDSKSVKVNKLKLDQINLSELHSIQNALNEEKKDIDSIEEPSIEATPSYYTLVLYVFIIIVLILIVTKYFKKMKKKEEKDNKLELSDIII